MGVDELKLPYELQDALELLVSDAAFVLYLRLLRFAAIPVLNRESNEGYLRVSVGRDEIARSRNRSSVSVAGYLKELEAVGAIRRVQNGSRIWDTYIRDPVSLTADLLTREDVTQGVADRFLIAGLPTWDDAKREAHEPTYVEWLGSEVSKTSNDLFARTQRITQEIANSGRRTAERRAVREAKAKPPKKKPSAKDKHPSVLITRFLDRVAVDLNLVPEPESKKLLGQMKQLLKRHEFNDVRRLVDFFASEEGWALSKESIWQLKDAIIPRVGDLLRFDAELLNLMNGVPEKRSGGAQDLDPGDLSQKLSF